MKSIIHVSPNYVSGMLRVNSKWDFAKVVLKEYMAKGVPISIDSLTPELKQIIIYNNGYLEHKYTILYDT